MRVRATLVLLNPYPSRRFDSVLISTVVLVWRGLLARHDFVALDAASGIARIHHQL
jgi:hypothetical protein